MSRMECGKDMYFDPGTNSCAYCSQLCYYVDIQGTREECVKRCPGYLETPEINSPMPLHEGTTEATDLSSIHPSTVAFIMLCCAAVLILVGSIMFIKRKSIIRRLKGEECCPEGMSSQPHVQECGFSPSQPQDGFLANQGYPDLPLSIRCSFNSQETRV